MSKRMKKAAEALVEGKAYSLPEAIENLSRFPKLKFDETVELHFHLATDPKTSDQSVRGTVALPHGTGKKIRIAVICKGELEQKAKDAGADYVGSTDLIDKIAKGFMDFDVVVATPDMMRDLSKLGKILGPKGLMPTPKAGTVTQDVEKAIKEIKAGKIEFKSDKQSGIHVGVGKRSFSNDQLVDNIKLVVEAVNNTKPASIKTSFIKSLYVATSMGPGVKVSI